MVIEEREHEQDSGSYPHDIWETVVARKGESFIKLAFESHSTAAYGARFRSGVTSEELISAEEYTRLATTPIIDTREELDRYASSESAGLNYKKPSI